MKPFRLAVSCGDPTTPLSLSRACGPLLAMSRENRALDIVLPPNNARDWVWLAGCDGLFMEQAYTLEDLAVALQAQRLGIPIWLDYGDDVFSVDKSNPAWLAFSDVKAIKENIGNLISMASFVTTPTKILHAIYAGVSADGKLAMAEGKGKAEHVLLPEACQWPASTIMRRQKIITWRGLASHADDLPAFAQQLIEVLRAPEFNGWTLLLFGDPVIKQIAANCMEDTGINLAVAPWFNSPWGMMNAWNGAAPYLHLCPLPNTPFNRGRPPSVWLEASAVGAATIAPYHLVEWHVPGMIHYSDSALVTPRQMPDFATVLRRELRTFAPISEPRQDGLLRGAMHPAALEARRAIYPEMTLAAVNRVRWEIVGKMQNAKCKMQNGEAPAV